MAYENDLFSLDEQARQCVAALAPIYGSKSAAVREALARLYDAHFKRTSAAPDAVLEEIDRHLSAARQAIAAEWERRGEERD